MEKAFKGLDLHEATGNGELVYRLQQPVENPINDNTNILWKRPSSGKNTAIGYRGIINLTFLSVEGKKGSNSCIFLV